MAGANEDRKCELCLYPAHLQCKCQSSPTFVCPSCVLRHIRMNSTIGHKFYPLDEALAQAEYNQSKDRSQKGTVKPKLEEPPRFQLPAEKVPCAPASRQITAVVPVPVVPSAPIQPSLPSASSNGIYTCPLCKAVVNNFLAFKAHTKTHLK